MITFTRIKYQNFLAAGNAPIDVRLDQHPATLVVGNNGSGKSTLSEAISFALFGRPLRGVTKPRLVNSINQRDCLVELWFTILGVPYHVRRGIKPQVFEIYQNGTLLPTPANANDYQTILETDILKLNFKAFQQVVILGNASYIPFMRLTPGHRRELVESLLDIEVFGAMNALNKDDLAAVKTELDRLQQTRDSVNEMIRLAQTYHDHQEEQRQQQVTLIDTNIVQVTQTCADLERDKVDLMNDLAPYETVRKMFADAQAKQGEYERLLADITGRDKKARRERQFYSEHDTCPTCEQTISDEFKQDRYNTLTKTEEDAARAIVQCRALIEKYAAQVAEAQLGLDQAAVIQRAIDAIDAKLPVHRVRITELKRERERVLATQYPVATAGDVEQLQQQLADVETKLEELTRRRVIVEAAAMLLRDNGIKAKVIRHFIPVINRLINHYLTALDFPISFCLDEEFTESIKSRHRDDFAYDSFSEGEKKRIDLALLLTWRAVARLKNSASTNLLILDEVFDSSLDANGTEEFLKIIANMESDTNILVISHKTDVLVDKFAHVVVFEKARGFSTIKMP
jgi:DNA repair exonuclease SbcCD ATPase subunit